MGELVEELAGELAALEKGDITEPDLAAARGESRESAMHVGAAPPDTEGFIAVQDFEDAMGDGRRIRAWQF